MASIQTTRRTRISTQSQGINNISLPLSLTCAFALLLSSCSLNQTTSPTNTNQSTQDYYQQSPRDTIMKLASSAFTNGQPLPSQYTCDGQDTNPPLQITEVPEKTQSLALIVDDPDAPAGTWTHWLVWNINPQTTVIKENSLPQGATQGTNSFGNTTWKGPCPPPGPAHRYVFKLFALDTTLDLPVETKTNQLEQTLSDHLLDQTQLTATYQRK